NKNHEEWVVQEKAPQYDKALKKRREAYYNKKSLVVQEKFGSARKENLVVQEREKKTSFLAPTKETLTKERLQKKDLLSVKKFNDDSVEIKLSKLLYSLILKRNGDHKPPNMEKWAYQIG
ncbi:unnamed protein product, partial [marine sediment metagenome]